VKSTEHAPATIVLVRHGETDWNAEGRCQGTADVPLNARGVDQVVRLAERLGGMSIHAAYTSPLRRARDTAERIIAGRDIVTTVIPAFAELAYGRYTGTVQGDWPREDALRWTQTPWDVEFDGGESLQSVHARAVPEWERIMAAHRGQTVLVSGHGHLNRVLLLHSTGRPLTDFWNLEQANGDAVVVRGNTCYSLTSYLAQGAPEEVSA
jgi:broad specificity phosphatase PhoE